MGFKYIYVNGREEGTGKTYHMYNVKAMENKVWDMAPNLTWWSVISLFSLAL
jgi:hypothetical protein